jgi:hypothetical protein
MVEKEHMSALSSTFLLSGCVAHRTLLPQIF